MDTSTPLFQTVNPERERPVVGKEADKDVTPLRASQRLRGQKLFHWFKHDRPSR
jgi:hypothetical protein